MVEYIDCGDMKTIDCSTYYAKQFTFNHGEVRLIATSEVDGESYGAEFERTENKHIEIFSALRSQTAFDVVDHYWLVFIDGRSCGASSCNGSLQILKVSAP
jgi:hypothetical protein